jgi:predicted small lipoprotein YifL
MKKTAVILMLLAMMLTLLAGCGGGAIVAPKPSASQADNEDTTSAKPEETDDTDVTEPVQQDNDDPSAGVVESLAPAGNPSEGFTNYTTFKSAAFERITAASEGSDDLAMTIGFGYLGVTMIDLSLLSLSMFTGDIQASEMAMEMLGMEGVKIDISGNDFTITYNDPEGSGSFKQTCSYDPGTDQLTSTLYDENGGISIFFEYVNLGGAYAAQYYYPSEETFEIIRTYFDKDNVAAFGILSAADEPASIIGKSGFNAEFVKNEQSYIVLEDGKLTVFDNGTVTTN